MEHEYSKKHRACKVIPRIRREKQGRDRTASITNEFKLLWSLDHPNIVSLFEVFQDSDYFYLVMEYGGDLVQRLKKEKQPNVESETKLLVRQVFLSLAYLHDQRIAHKDVKAENLVLVDNLGTVKLVDFGLAERTSSPDQTMTTKQGAPVYVPPEMLQTVTASYTVKCDVWSGGVLAFYLVNDIFPFDIDPELVETIHKPEVVLYNKIRQYGKTQQPRLPFKDERDRAFIESLLLPEARRPSALVALQHPWLAVPEPDPPHLEGAYRHLMRWLSIQSPVLRTVLTAITAHHKDFVESQQGEDARILFGVLDLDHNGILTRNEICLFVEFGWRRRNPNVLPKELQEGRPRLQRNARLAIEWLQLELRSSDYDEPEKRMFESLGLLEGDGSIVSEFPFSVGWTEFLAGTFVLPTELPTEVVDAEFRFFDKNNNGKISADELRPFADRSYMNLEGRTAAVPLRNHFYTYRLLRDDIMANYDAEDDRDGELSLDEFRGLVAGFLVRE